MTQENGEALGVIEFEVERRVDARRFAALERRLEDLDAMVNATAAEVKANTALTQAIKANTDEIVELFQAAKGIVRIGGAVGSAAQWVAKVVAVGVILWAVFRFGVSEALKQLWGLR